MNRLPGATVQLYAADGTLIASTTTGLNGVYRFNTNFSGMGYIQLVGIPTYDVSAKGTIHGDGTVSAIDPTSLRSDVVQFISGVAVGEGVDIVLYPVATTLKDGANALALHRASDRSILWNKRIGPISYKGGYDVKYIDLNGDTTTDYLSLTKVGTPRLYAVDGRTGTVTRIAGRVGADLRVGMIVQEADVAGDGNTEFVVSPKHGISGRISVIDLQTDRVLWTSRQSVCGGMTVNVVGSNTPGRNRSEDIRISSIAHPHVWKILDGQTGRVVEVAKPSPGHHHGDSARLARTHFASAGPQGTPPPR